MKINIQMKSGKDREQVKLFRWAAEQVEFVPELALMFHIPRGERGFLNQEMCKTLGMKAGVPDIMLPVAAWGKAGLAIEMMEKKTKLAREQEEYMQLLQEYNWKTAVCYSFEEAREVIRHYLSRAGGFDLVNCEEARKVNHRCLGVDVGWAPCPICIYYHKGDNKSR